ncbi:MAG: 3'(2'),5'-bisphosphate nucleotidase CysQ [Pseudomonadota bacterium]
MTNRLALMDRLKPAVLRAGDAIMNVYHRLGESAPEAKTDGSPVTEADLAANIVLMEALEKHAPGIAVVSEESEETHARPPQETFLLVDPLDGTREFIKADGKGAFTVNIGLIEGGLPVAGVVYAPALEQYFVGSVGEGAILNGRAINTRPLRATGPVAVASLSHRDPETDAWLSEHRIRKTRAIGSSLKFGLLATGEADLYPRFGPTMEWDTAAGDAILRAAGGVVTQPDGQPFTYGKPGYRNGPFIASGRPRTVYPGTT